MPRVRPALLAALLLLTPSLVRAQPPALGHRLYVSPAEIRRFDTRTLGELLVERLHAECDVPGSDAASGEPVGARAELIMMVPASKLPSIAKYGFLNQHATLTTQGVYRIPDRFAAEQELAMARLPYSRKGKELLPKYALFVANRPDFGSFPLPSRYGNVAVVFKKSVMKRTTWTYADSSDFHFQAGRFSRGGAANPVLTHTALYRRKPEDKNKCVNYCEAQIWGGLTFDDVDYVMVRGSEPVEPALRESGLRVYRYSDEPGASSGYARGALLSIPRASADGFSGGADGAVENHLKDLERESLSDSDLVERVPRSPSSLGELAARPKSAAIVRSLGAAWKSEDAATRAAALYGLSELPWAEFRPFLSAALEDKSPLVNTQAIAFASEHRDDPGITRLLSGLEGRPARELAATSDWLQRLRLPRLCARD